MTDGTLPVAVVDRFRHSSLSRRGKIGLSVVVLGGLSLLAAILLLAGALGRPSTPHEDRVEEDGMPATDAVPVTTRSLPQPSRPPPTAPVVRPAPLPPPVLAAPASSPVAPAAEPSRPPRPSIAQRAVKRGLRALANLAKSSHDGGTGATIDGR